MKKKMIAVISLILVTALIFAGCSFDKNDLPEDTEAAETDRISVNDLTEEANDTTKDEQYHQIKELNIEVLNNANKESVFSFSIDDFIESFNGYYYENYGRNFLTSSENWESYISDETAHSNYPAQHYSFREDLNSYNDPSISVYVPENSNYVQEISLDFPEHSYTEWGYEAFKENCFYTLKVFFPDFNDEQIQNLYSVIYDEVYEANYYFKSAQTPSPMALYYRGNIGIYAYFRVGMLFIALIPITEQYLTELQSNKVETYKIDDFI